MSERTSGAELPAESGLSPDAALAVIDYQRVRTVAELYGDPGLLLFAWATVWIVGFGAFYFATDGSHALPVWVASLVMGALAALAVALSMKNLALPIRGVSGPRAHTVRRFAWSWPLTAAAMFALDFALERGGLSNGALSVLWPGTFMVAAGIEYLAAGMLFGDSVHYRIGIWTLAVASGAAFAGSPGNFAVMALAGGGGLLAGAVAVRSKAARLRRAK